MKLKKLTSLLIFTLLLSGCNTAPSKNESCTIQNTNATTQVVENHNESLYDIYKNRYGYVGSEDDFYQDLGYGHVGTKKTYKITFMSVFYHQNEIIAKDVVFKNGEKVDFSKYNQFDYYIILKTTDNLDFMADIESHSGVGIDVNNYRAYKDCTIIFHLDDYDIRPGISLYMHEPNDVFSVNKEIDLDFQYHFGYGNEPLTEAEASNVELLLEPDSVEAIYNKDKSTVLVKKAGDLKFKIKYLDKFTSVVYIFHFA